jgi:hypothetical protein
MRLIYADDNVLSFSQILAAMAVICSQRLFVSPTASYDEWSGL